MAATAMAALKELVDSEDFLQSIAYTTPAAAAGQGAFFQVPPDDVDLSTGDLFLFDFENEDWSYTTESVMKSLTCSVIGYCNSFVRADQIVAPALEFLLEDAEQFIEIAGHDSYNLEILSVQKGVASDVEDKLGNPVSFVKIALKLEYQRPRKRSADALDS